ncbi:hypothetical protein COK43_10385 [Bacillus cereus]|nr:hypothetical protein COK43_10385 [Bacillus cereus]PGQ80481.1 hypothetical protein COA15_19935 [Bacillus anthracis]
MFKKKNGFRVLSIFLLVVFFLLIFMLLFFLMAEVGKKDGLTIGLGLIGNVLGGLIGGGFTLLAIGETIKQNKRVAEIEKIPDKLILLEDMKSKLTKQQDNIIKLMDVIEERQLPDDQSIEVLIKDCKVVLSATKKQSMQINKDFYKEASSHLECIRKKLIRLDFGLPYMTKEMEIVNKPGYVESEDCPFKSITESKIEGLLNKLYLFCEDLHDFKHVIEAETEKYEDSFFGETEQSLNSPQVIREASGEVATSVQKRWWQFWKQ